MLHSQSRSDTRAWRKALQIGLMYLFAQGAGPADLCTVLLNLWLGSHLQEATARDDFLMELWHSQQN